jgi:hypothetical protein
MRELSEIGGPAPTGGKSGPRKSFAAFTFAALLKSLTGPQAIYIQGRENEERAGRQPIQEAAREGEGERERERERVRTAAKVERVSE